MAGLVPAIHVLSDDGFIKIVPVGVIDNDLPDFPGARPMFDIVLALNSGSDIVENLKVNEALYSVLFGKTFDRSRAMLKYATSKIVRDADT